MNTGTSCRESFSAERVCTGVGWGVGGGGLVLFADLGMKDFKNAGHWKKLIPFLYNGFDKHENCLYLVWYYNCTHLFVMAISFLIWKELEFAEGMTCMDNIVLHLP